MSETVVRVERDGLLAWVIIDRPEAHNAMNAAAWRAAAGVLQALGTDGAVRVIVIRGAGDAAFISGADISEFPALRADAVMAKEYDRLAIGVWTAVAAAPQPVIAMINGLCYGGGVSVSIACDLRFAAATARFAVPAARLGLAYPMDVGVERLVHVVGPAHAADILLSGRALDAEEALRIGLVNRVVASADLAEFTRTYAMKMAEGAPLTLAAHKRMIREALRPEQQRDTKKVQEAVARCYSSRDYQEGIAAFLEKRKPVFRGE